MSYASVGDNWEPPAHWESDVIGDYMGASPVVSGAATGAGLALLR